MAHSNTPNGSGIQTSREKRLTECYNRGLQLSRSEKNYEYAHVMLTECVRSDPGNLQFVEALIQNLKSNTPHHSKRRLFSRTPRPLCKAVQLKDWEAAISIGLEGLWNDPWNTAVLLEMAHACEALHHNEVELVYLKQALEAEPKNLKVNRHCARSLGRMGQFDQAIACWHRIEVLQGRDDEASKMISTLAEEKLKFPGGRPPTTKRKDVKDASNSESKPEETKEVALSSQQKLEQAITLDPKNVTNYVELAELLLNSSQYNAAESLLTRAIAVCGSQKSLVKQLERTQYRRAEAQRAFTEDRKAEEQIEKAPIRIPWLELALVATAAMLVLQLVPSLGAVTLRAVDVRNWSRPTWFLFNIFILLALAAIKFAPNWSAFKRQRLHRKRRI